MIREANKNDLDEILQLVLAMVVKEIIVGTTCIL